MSLLVISMMLFASVSMITRVIYECIVGPSNIRLREVCDDKQHDRLFDIHGRFNSCGSNGVSLPRPFPPSRTTNQGRSQGMYRL